MFSRRSFLAGSFLAAVALLMPSRKPKPPSAFVQRSGQQLTLNGQPFRFKGLNVYNANSRGNCWYPITSLALPAGTTVIRAWFFEPLATSNGVRSWAAFDATIAACKAAGARIIATLGDQWGGCDGGGYKTESWYASGYRTTYRPWVSEIVTRYKDEPTILAWELLNEPEDMQSSTGPCSVTAHTTLKAWAADVSSLVKSIDSNHLIGLGIGGGGQCGASYTEYADLHSIAAVDLCSYHDYSPPDVTMPGDQWNGLAFRFQQAAALNKPLVIGEAGILGSAVPSLQYRADAFAAKMQAQAAAVGYLMWNWCQPHDAAYGACDSQSYDIAAGDPALSLLP